jgi:hypothetical protein
MKLARPLVLGSLPPALIALAVVRIQAWPLRLQK